MSEHEQIFDQAMAAFVSAHQSETLESIPAFLQSYPVEERPALLDAIEEYLEIEAEIALYQPDAEMLALVSRAQEQTLATLHTPVVSLTDLRNQRGMLTNRLARAIKLPPDFLSRLERGGVIISSIPQRQLHLLVSRLADALQQTHEVIGAALRSPTSDTVGMRLSAEDDTHIEETVAIPFSEALSTSAGLTDEMRHEWLGDDT